MLGLTTVYNIQIEIRWIRIVYEIFSTVAKYIKFSDRCTYVVTVLFVM
jgi:hypothetical protein